MRVHNLSGWPEFEQFAHSFNLATLSKLELNHVPFPVILFYANQTWHAKYGASPKTPAQKTEFKNVIKSFDRFSGINFDEANANYSECFKTDDLPETLANVFANLDKEHG